MSNVIELPVKINLIHCTECNGHIFVMQYNGLAICETCNTEQPWTHTAVEIDNNE